MIQVLCDLCGKPIKYSGDKVTVTTEGGINRMGCSSDGEYHFHMECFTRLENKVNHFVKEMVGD